jgi:hypothetical protein
VASWAAGAAGWVVSCVLNPLDRPCDELGEPLGSELCTADGAVLCVVGVACWPATEPPDAPGAVLCVVGVACELDAADAAGAVVGEGCELDTESLDPAGTVPCVVGEGCELDAGPLDAAGAVPSVVGVETCDDGDVVPVECALWPETGSDEVEPPRSA